jgi:hypothetical protein
VEAGGGVRRGLMGSVSEKEGMELCPAGSSHLHLGQQIGEGADGGGLAGAAVSHDHDASDLGVNHVEDERQLHLLLAHDGAEGEDGPGGSLELAALDGGLHGGGGSENCK